MPNDVTSNFNGIMTEVFAPRPFEVIYFLIPIFCCLAESKVGQDVYNTLFMQRHIGPPFFNP
jgi:hypothetical protein